MFKAASSGKRSSEPAVPLRLTEIVRERCSFLGSWSVCGWGRLFYTVCLPHRCFSVCFYRELLFFFPILFLYFDLMLYAIRASWSLASEVAYLFLWSLISPGEKNNLKCDDGKTDPCTFPLFGSLIVEWNGGIQHVYFCRKKKRNKIFIFKMFERKKVYYLF